MIYRESISAVFWIVLGLVISLWSTTFPFGSLKSLGPGCLPFVCGITFIILGSIFLYQLRKNSKEEKKIEENILPERSALKRIFLSSICILLAASLFDYLGFTATIFCLTFFLLRIIDTKKLLEDLFFALIFTAGSYILFQIILKMFLPKGIIGY